MRFSHARAAFLLAGTAILVLTASEAKAEPEAAASDVVGPPSPTKDVREGDRALARHDFRKAAEAYERAYKRAGSLGALIKAAQSWAHAGDPARSANLYADYLASAPPGAPQRPKASKALKKLTSKLGRIDVQAVDVDHLTLDGAPLDTRSSYVTVGAHAVEGQTSDQRPVRASTSVVAGETTTVSLAPPPEVVAPPVAAPPATTPTTVASAQGKRHGWSPAVVVAGGVVTAGLLGLTAWSGLDTVASKDNFDKDQSRDNLDKGNSKQLRTNILVGATAGAAALTTLAAVFLVDWKGEKREAPGAPSLQVGLGVGSATMSGTF